MSELPTFIVIGSMKSGTTSLAQYLGAHPDVFMTRPKEPRFFTRDIYLERGIEWYRELFADGAHARARGEASTKYTRAPSWSGVPQLMASVVPDVRLLYLLRDPIDRLKSQYLFNVDRMRETRPIDEAVLDNPRYVDTSRYAFQLEQYLEHFDLAQILVLWSEDLRTRRSETLERALRFIGVAPDVEAVRGTLAREFNRTRRSRRPTRWHEHLRTAARWTPLRRLDPATKRRLYKRSGYKAKSPDTSLDPATRARLVGHFVPDGKRLEALIGETPPWLARLEEEARP